MGLDVQCSESRVVAFDRGVFPQPCSSWRPISPGAWIFFDRTSPRGELARLFSRKCRGTEAPTLAGTRKVKRGFS